MSEQKTIKCLCGASLTPEKLVNHKCDYYHERGRISLRGIWERGILVSEPLDPDFEAARLERERLA